MTGHAPVPTLLHGCWQRSWIRMDDGSADDTSTVIWLQLESKMADVRLSQKAVDLAYRGSLSECSIADLKTLSQSDSSSGYTTCTPITFSHGCRTATAEWFSDGGVAYQPVSAYPEAGLLEWSDDDVLIERAPSGAYVEEWRRQPGTSEGLRHRVIDDKTEVYRAGDIAILVRDRTVPVPRRAPLAELIAELTGTDDEIRQQLINLVDCEFTVARRTESGSFVITASTLPWRVGEVLANAETDGF